MWSSDRRSFLALAGLAALGACGFTPVYGPGGGGAALTGRVRPAAPDTTDDYILVREIETRLGRAGEGAPLALDYQTSVVEEGMAVTTSNVTTRFNVIGSVAYQLKDARTGLTLHEGRVRSFTSYSATGSTVATQAARRDARERLMVILADLLTTRLYAEAADLPA
jgi:LPS-assembly lipoprotein